MTRLTRNGAALLSACALGLAGASAAQASVLQHVFVIAMENHDGSQIYGNTTDAPYINNTLIPNYARATNYAGAVSYTHSSIIKSAERVLGLPILSTVSGSNDFTDLFNPGFFP